MHHQRIKDTQDICKNMGDLICSGACLLGSGGQDTRATPPRRLLRRLPELRAPPPSSLPRTPEASLSGTPIACMRKINIMDAHERS